MLSFQIYFPLKVVPKYLPFVDEGIEWLDNLNSGTRLWEHVVKCVAIALSMLMKIRRFVNDCSGSDVHR
jgi:hypothetical protein